MKSPLSSAPHDDKATEVFDVAHWLDRATSSRPAPAADYVPRHRAEEPAV